MGGQEVWADDMVGLVQSVLVGVALEYVLFIEVGLYMSKENVFSCDLETLGFFLVAPLKGFVITPTG